MVARSVDAELGEHRPLKAPAQSPSSTSVFSAPSTSASRSPAADLGRGMHYVLPGTGAVASVGLRCDDGEGGEGEGQRGRELEMAGVQARTTAPARLHVAVRIAAEAGRVTRAEYARVAKVSQRTAKRDLAELMQLGVLRAEGKRKGKRRAYVPAAADARR
jgi:hypothetical protein